MALLIILFLGLAYLDFLYTNFMLKRHGLGIELNPFIPWLAQKYGRATGICIGIAAPTLVVLLLGINFRPFLEGVTLARLMLFYFQAKNLRRELATH